MQNIIPRWNERPKDGVFDDSQIFFPLRLAVNYTTFASRNLIFLLTRIGGENPIQRTDSQNIFWYPRPINSFQSRITNFEEGSTKLIGVSKVFAGITTENSEDLRHGYNKQIEFQFSTRFVFVKHVHKKNRDSFTFHYH